MKLGAKRWWTRFITVLAVLLVSAASLSLGFRLLIDAVPGYRGDLERLVTASVGHPARIGTMALTWRAFSPTLELHDLALLDAAGQSLLEARKLSLGISLGRLISGPRAPDRIEAEGLQLIAHADADGHLSLEGIDLTGRGDRSLAADFARYARLRLRDCRLRLIDARLGAEAAPLDFVLDEAQLRHGRSGYSVNARLQPPESLARRLHLVALISGDLAQPETLAGHWQLQVTDIAGWPWLAAQLRPGVQLAFEAARLQVDGELQGGRPAAMTLQLQVGSMTARVAHAEAPLARLSDVDVEARFEPAHDGGWQLQLPKATLSGARGAWSLAGLTATENPDGHRQLQVPLLRLDDLAPWFTTWRDLPAALARLRDVEGDLRTVQLSAGPKTDGQPGAVELQARLAGVGLASRDDQDGITGLDGDLVASRDRGLIRLAGTQVALHLPRLFEQSLPVDALRGELHWQGEGDQWQIDVPSVELKVGAAGVRGSVGLSLHPDRVPDLKLRLQLQSDEVAQLKPWMPKNWGEHTRAWLDQAIREARVSAGELLIDAPLTPRDADNHPTLPWDLKLKVRDGVLAFAPDWPAAEAMSAELHFHDGGLDIEASKGRISRLDVTRLHASIANFFDPHLTIDAAFAGDAADLYQLFRDSPLKTRVSGLLAHTEASGPAAATLALRLPLNVAQPPIDASGMLGLHGVELRIRGLPEPLRQLTGELAYGRSISADHLTARLYDTEVQAAIRALEPVPEPLLSGSFDLEPGRNDGLAAAFIPAWLRAGLSGATTMQLQLPLGGADNGHLSLNTDLQGVASSLPQPLAKTAGSALPVSIDLGGDSGATRLGIRAGDETMVGLRLADDGANGTHTHGVEVWLGKGGAMPRADTEGLVIRGAPEHLDLGGWIALLGSPGNGLAASGSSAPRFLGADIEARQLSLRRLQFGPTRLIAKPDGDGLEIHASGAATGLVQWQPADGGRIVGRLAAMSLDAFPPLPAGPPGSEPADSPFDPTRAPLFDLDIETLNLGGVALGHLNLVTARVDDGQRIEQLSLADGHLQASASGYWLRRPQASGETGSETGRAGASAGSSADLHFDLRSDAIDEVLRVFGYTPNLVAKASHFSGAVAWPRVPAGLELSQAVGSIDIALERGSLKAVEPGAGRVLGLVNLYALPRRLLFDFRDVVSEGLGFDELKGSFKLAEGDAVTDNLDIDGPSLKVQMRGRIGLAARDYDQKVTVFPDLSTGVTVGAALLGGPIAGGILLVAQQLFDKPFNQLGKFSYRVTGSWDDPTVIKSGEAALPAATVPVPAAVKPSNG